MSREIKFRFWDKANKKMIIPGVTSPDDKDFCFYALKLEGSQLIAIFQNIDEGYWEAVDAERDEFTGLKDKHGREIYEGDIFEYMNDEGEVEIVAVGWEEFEDSEYPYYNGVGFSFHFGGYHFGHYHDKHGNLNIEIIGNIHENPELIE